MESQSNSPESLDGANSATPWTLEQMAVGQSAKTYRFKPSDKSGWCYISGLSYPGNWFQEINDPAITNTDYIQCTVWIDCVPVPLQCHSPGDLNIIPAGLFDSYYGLFESGRDWWSVKVSTMNPQGSSHHFPSGVHLYSVDEHGTNIALIGFLDLTDPRI